VDAIARQVLEETMIANRVALVAVLPLMTAGCGLFDKGKDLIDGLTNPLVAQAIVLGAQLPQDAGDIDFPAEFADGVTVSIFLADAADVADLENAPIGGAAVTVEQTTIPEVQPGAYALEPDATWEIAVTIGGSSSHADVDLPPPADFTPPAQHSANTPLTVDFTGQEFDGALLVVVDQDGAITFDNRPADIRDVYNLTRGEAPGVIEIPASAFPAAGAYAVGVAGIRSTSGNDRMDGMNTVLSSAMAGQLVFEAMAVSP
jgi:hypothetical protein